MVSSSDTDSVLRLQAPPFTNLDDILKAYITNLYAPESILKSLQEFETDSCDQQLRKIVLMRRIVIKSLTGTRKNDQKEREV